MDTIYMQLMYIVHTYEVYCMYSCIEFYFHLTQRLLFIGSNIVCEAEDLTSFSFRFSPVTHSAL